MCEISNAFLRALSLVVAPVLIVGCAAPQPAGPASGPASVGADGGPHAWAAAAQNRCKAAPDVEAKTRCYEEILVSGLTTQGVRSAMEMLNLLGTQDADARHQGHVLAHVVGLAAYRSADQVGEVFAECTPIFQSGCYHGVIQAYFADLQRAAPHEQPSTEQLNRLCSDYRGADGNRWLLFQCVHGMGHGLVALHDYHLPHALQGCDLLSDGWEREGCYGGAFMENLVSATMPHHAPGDTPHGGAAHGAQQGGGHHAGTHEPAAGQDHAHHQAHPAGAAHGEHAHAMHEHGDHHAANVEPFPALDPANPHHPCSSLDERYLNACYLMQTSAVLFWSNGDISRGVALCEGAPEQARYACYVSLGRDISAYSMQNHESAIEKCRLAPAQYQPWCLTGFVKHLVDLTADADDGLAFCRAVTEDRSRRRCFQAVGEQIAILESSPARRETRCSELQGDDARACRLGADLPDGRPAAMR